MNALSAVGSTGAPVERGDARLAWRRRAVLVGGAFQVMFGAVWIARGLAPLLSGVAVAVASAVLVAGGIATAMLWRRAPRPKGPVARRIGRRLTVATLLQLAASFTLPVLCGAIGVDRLSLPSVAVTIGILLVWLHHEIGTPFQGPAGWALVALAIVGTSLSGATQEVVTGLCSATVLLSSAGLGLRWLRRASATAARPARRSSTRARHGARHSVEGPRPERASASGAVRVDGPLGQT